MIRKFQDNDTNAVVSTWRAASALAHPFLTATFLDQEAEAMRNVYLGLAQTWVTEIDGHVVGFISIIGDEIGGLFLDPRHHGRGLGRALLDKAIAEKGPLKVEVFKENTIGRRFYDACGFHAVDEYVHEPSGQETIRMALDPQ